MADVRSMLRTERAARRINHPQAQYTPTGVLTCKACRVQVKSDALWQSHISSPQHVGTLKKLASGLMAQNAPKGTKRKADDDEDDESGEALRKRAKATDEARETKEPEGPQQAVTPPPEETLKAKDPVQSQGRTAKQTEIDEDEWAAFERDVATPPPETQTQPAIMANATISAAPMTAAELAAKSRAEASVQAKERREAEIEGEKEDAQRRLEEEFDEMDALEERVKKLKERREALRQRTFSETKAASILKEHSSKSPDADEGEEESDEEDDDWDNWGMR